jgi:hypothetical protein
MQSVRYVVTFGEAMLRLSPPPGRRLRATGELTTHVAGAEANVAAALAALGVPCAWTSVLPNTPLGRRAAAELSATGVDSLPRTLLVLVASAGLLTMFLIVEGRVREPTLPPAIWSYRSLVSRVGLIVGATALLVAVFFFSTIYLQDALGEAKASAHG